MSLLPLRQDGYSFCVCVCATTPTSTTTKHHTTTTPTTQPPQHPTPTTHHPPRIHNTNHPPLTTHTTPTPPTTTHQQHRIDPSWPQVGPKLALVDRMLTHVGITLPHVGPKGYAVPLRSGPAFDKCNQSINAITQAINQSLNALFSQSCGRGGG